MYTSRRRIISLQVGFLAMNYIDYLLSENIVYKSNYSEMSSAETVQTPNVHLGYTAT